MATSSEQLLVKQAAGQTREVAVAFDLSIGGNRPVVMSQLPDSGGSTVRTRAALDLAAAGVDIMRIRHPGQAPYVSDLWTEADVKELAAVRAVCGRPVAVEVSDANQGEELARHVDLLVVPGSNMQNFSLLKRLGKLDCPVILERGPANTVDEWLMAAEYLLAGGNRRIILCAGASRSADGAEPVLDLAGAMRIRAATHLPVISDLSALGGEMALPLARAVLAAGLHGVGLGVAEPQLVRETMAALGRVPATAADLEALRMLLDGLDAQILDLLNRRMLVSQAIGQVKAESGMPVYQPGREQRVLEQVTDRARQAGEGLAPEAVQAIWGTILRWSRHVQSTVRVHGVAR